MCKPLLAGLLSTACLFAQTTVAGGTTVAGVLPLALDSNLTAFNTALDNAATTPVNIKIFGDSLSRCYNSSCASTPINPASLWVEQLRSYLTARFGSHGTGVIPIQNGVFGGGNVDPFNWTLTGTYTQDSTFGPSERFVGVGSTYVLASGATASLGSHYGSSANIYILQNGGETAAGFTATVDGTNAGTFAASSSSGPAVITVPLGAPGSHTLLLAPVQGSPMRLYGVEFITGGAGISVHNLGEGGCQSDCFGGAPAAQEAFSDIIPGGAQLDIIALGTNDGLGGVSIDAYTANLQALVTHEKSLSPAPTIIVMNQPWGSPSLWTGPTQAQYFAAAQNVAAGNGVDFYDPTTSSLFESYAHEQALGWLALGNTVHLADLGQQEWGQWVIGQMFGQFGAAAPSVVSAPSFSGGVLTIPTVVQYNSAGGAAGLVAQNTAPSDYSMFGVNSNGGQKYMFGVGNSGTSNSGNFVLYNSNNGYFPLVIDTAGQVTWSSSDPTQNLFNWSNQNAAVGGIHNHQWSMGSDGALNLFDTTAGGNFLFGIAKNGSVVAANDFVAIGGLQTNATGAARPSCTVDGMTWDVHGSSTVDSLHQVCQWRSGKLQWITH